ncbi:DinB family protein [Hoyosella sp. YIM 151337]|uniref:DinB family protein n=1 Tax=Hoyosella sp. YIM 151337 TaxID=2992742 RepID=UPI0022369C03|nr:DinB family protein [Hoyosella sp. YIM 151337]MCW4352561.1 DinB family protein [Hoyosella sp. YIM 151337]
MSAVADNICQRVLKRQFELTWSLLELHLAALDPATDLLWEPAVHCWTMHQGPDGRWMPDFAETEPDPIPVPTIAWLTWHIGWWWTAAVASVKGGIPPDIRTTRWPGPNEETLRWLHRIRSEWQEVFHQVNDADLARPVAVPWSAAEGHSLADLLAWVNAELMKNAAEIGQLRILRNAGTGAEKST